MVNAARRRGALRVLNDAFLIPFVGGADAHGLELYDTRPRHAARDPLGRSCCDDWLVNRQRGANRPCATVP